MAIRIPLRVDDVLKATPWRAKATLYQKIAEGKFPKSTKMDPTGQAVVWFEDEIEAWQKGEWKPAPEQPNEANLMPGAYA